MTESRPDDAGDGLVAGSDRPARLRALAPFVALSAVVALVLAVGAIALSPRDVCACLPDPSPGASAGTDATPDVASPVDGVIVSIDSGGLSDVRGFVLRPSGGFAFDFVLGRLENATEFPPGHLAEHLATSSPVRVYFRVQDGNRVVYRLEDAP